MKPVVIKEFYLANGEVLMPIHPQSLRPKSMKWPVPVPSKKKSKAKSKKKIKSKK